MQVTDEAERSAIERPDKPHPTRQEWEARQERMPGGMRRLIDSHLSDRNAEHAAALAAEEARAKSLRDRLAGFELALREVLASCPELQQYRESAPPELAASKFCEEHRSWWAFFNLEPVGGWRLMIEIPFACSTWSDWEPQAARFTAKLPSHDSTADTLAKALWLVSQYCWAPF